MYRKCPRAYMTHATWTACKTCNTQQALVHLHEHKLCMWHAQHTAHRHTSRTTHTEHTRAHTAWLKRPGALRGKSALTHPCSHAVTFLRKRSEGLKVVLRSRSALSVQPGSGFRVGRGQRSAADEDRTQSPGDGSPRQHASRSAPAPSFQNRLLTRHYFPGAISTTIDGQGSGHEDWTLEGLACSLSCTRTHNACTRTHAHTPHRPKPGRAHVAAAGEVVHHPGGDVVHPGQDLLPGVHGHLPIAQQGSAAHPPPVQVWLQLPRPEARSEAEPRAGRRARQALCSPDPPCQDPGPLEQPVFSEQRRPCRVGR